MTHVVIGTALIILGLAQIIFPRTFLRLRSRMRRLDALDLAAPIYTSRFGATYIRICGAMAIIVGILFLPI